MTPDCSGQPYVEVPSGSGDVIPAWRVSTVVGPDRTLYVESGPNEVITSQSRIDDEGELCGQSSSDVEVYPAIAVADLDTLFVPPFSIVK